MSGLRNQITYRSTQCLLLKLFILFSYIGLIKYSLINKMIKTPPLVSNKQTKVHNEKRTVTFYLNKME